MSSSVLPEKATHISNKERFDKLTKAGTDTIQAETTTFSKIQKVTPLLLRDHENFEKYYEPRVVSIGPIHHGNSKFQAAEKYKLRWAYKFFQESGKPQLEDLHGAVKEKIKELRECFEEEVTKSYDDDALAWILFVDGCAMLQFLYCAVDDKRFKDLGIKHDIVALGQQDMFLLENQLPYCLLESLIMSCRMNRTKVTKLKQSIDIFIERNIKGTRNEESKPPPQHTISIQEETPIHLLHLLRTKLLGDSHPQLQQANAGNTGSQEENNQVDNWQSFRHVQELKAAGIFLKDSGSSSLRNISFTIFLKFYPGYLHLPRITVDDSTGSKFMNLIAYEMCPDFENDYGVTSYISFLDSLIDQHTDDQELRKARILYNLLGSDQEVAKLFNEIGTVPIPDAYKNVKNQIQSYYNNQWMTWIAEVMHNHFSSPWTVLAFLGAIVALVLTAIRTWTSWPN